MINTTPSLKMRLPLGLAVLVISYMILAAGNCIIFVKLPLSKYSFITKNIRIMKSLELALLGSVVSLSVTDNTNILLSGYAHFT